MLFVSAFDVMKELVYSSCGSSYTTLLGDDIVSVNAVLVIFTHLKCYNLFITKDKERKNVLLVKQ